MENYCYNCGNRIETGWSACPNCGKPLNKNPNPLKQLKIKQQENFRNPYQHANRSGFQKPSGSSEGTIYGSLALIFGIVGLFFGFNIGITAIVLGVLGIAKEDTSFMSLWGIVIGIIDLICFFIGFFIGSFTIWGILVLIW